MKMENSLKLGSLAVMIMVSIHAAHAADHLRDQINGCAAIDSAAKRLDCYDMIGAAQARPSAVRPPNADYREMALDDLKLDAKSIMGTRVRTTGLFDQLGEMGMLASELMDASPVWLDISRLSRDERKQLLGCQHRRCRVTVVGTVTGLMFGPGVIAESAEIQ